MDPFDAWRRSGIPTLAAAALAAVGGWSVPAMATDPCQTSADGSGQKIPNCEPQAQPAVSYQGLGFQNWTFSCSGDHPYFWGIFYGYAPSYAVDSLCFQVDEQPSWESVSPGLFGASIANFCPGNQALVVTLACSSTYPEFGARAPAGRAELGPREPAPIR
ncbi:MAG: hypothetical protein AB7O95_28645 [Geminicoccaceae bacterium]